MWRGVEMIKKNWIIFLAHGFLLLLFSIFFAQFVSVPANGFKVDQSKWPVEAKIIQEKILTEDFSEKTKIYIRKTNQSDT